MTFLMECVVACLLFAAWLVPGLLRDPLAWAGSYPPAVRRRLVELGLYRPERRTGAELARKAVFCAVAVVLLAGILVMFNSAVTFFYGFCYAWLLWLVVDLFDAVVLDCLWFAHSAAVRIPGTEGMEAGYRDYLFYLKGGAVGALLGLPVSLLVGCLTAFSGALLA